MFDKIVNGFVKTFIAEDRYKMFLNGFWNTIQIAFVANACVDVTVDYFKGKFDMSFDDLENVMLSILDRMV